MSTSEVLTGAVGEPVPKPTEAWIDSLTKGCVVPVAQVEQLLGVKRNSEVWQIRLNSLANYISGVRTKLYVTTGGGTLRVLSDDEAISHHIRSVASRVGRVRSAMRKFDRIDRGRLSAEKRREYDVLQQYYVTLHYRLDKDQRALARIGSAEPEPELDAATDVAED